MKAQHLCLSKKAMALWLTTLLVLSICSCGDNSSNEESSAKLTPATGASRLICAEIVDQFAFQDTEITGATLVAAGTLDGQSVGEHCLVTGQMNDRVSAIDAETYAIGFEMRLPTEWNGRYLYQANGGIDGSVNTALGKNLGGGPTSSALGKGYAVISSDAGHPSPAPFFGIDPQARLDYGYNAVASLTPMAKSLIESAYAKGPDRSYIAGCSNGGRHAMVAAARFADQYDGILAGNPGFHLPLAAIAQLYGVQQYSPLATGLNGDGDPDISTALTSDETSLISEAILEQCDDLDGVADGIVADTTTCQGTFTLERDVPTCAGARDGTCLTADQKTAIGNIFAGARNSSDEAIYASFPYDPGIVGSNWVWWEHFAAQNLDPGAVAFLFTSPPSDFGSFVSQTGYQYAMNFSMDADAPKAYATDATYTVSSMDFMAPPNETDLAVLRDRGAKLMVFHGLADGVFSPNDTVEWYEDLDMANGGDARNFARLFLIPGMNHCSGGPCTDQFDMLDALVDWVEQGEEPDRLIATARGAGNVGGENTELPADWAPDRTRPLCPYPQIATYNGSGDIDDAVNFTCAAP